MKICFLMQFFKNVVIKIQIRIRLGATKSRNIHLNHDFLTFYSLSPTRGEIEKSSRLEFITTKKIHLLIKV